MNLGAITQDVHMIAALAEIHDTALHRELGAGEAGSSGGNGATGGWGNRGTAAAPTAMAHPKNVDDECRHYEKK